MNKGNNNPQERKYRQIPKKNYINMSIKELKNAAKQVKPTIQIGKNGLSENTLLEINKQLKTKKLVKIRYLRSYSAVSDVKESTNSIISQTESTLINSVGNIITIFKRGMF